MVFVYLDPVHDGDGGLCLLPGSHKSQFCRPRSLFGLYGAHPDATRPSEDDARVHELPAGMQHITVRAGDILVVPEATTHAVAPWRPTDRMRRYVRFRYKIGAADAANIAGGVRWPEEMVAGFTPATRAIVTPARL